MLYEVWHSKGGREDKAFVSVDKPITPGQMFKLQESGEDVYVARTVHPGHDEIDRVIAAEWQASVEPGQFAST